MAYGQHFEDRPQDDLVKALNGHFEHSIAVNVHKQGIATREAAVVLGARQPRQSTEQCRFAKVTQPNDGHAVARVEPGPSTVVSILLNSEASCHYNQTNQTKRRKPDQREIAGAGAACS